MAMILSLGLLDQLLGEHLCVAGGVGRRLRLLAGDDVELGHRVQLVVGALGRGVALALLGDDVDQHRLVGVVADVLQHRDQGVEVVPVDGPDIVEAQLLEQSPAGDHAAGVFLGLARGLLQGPRQGAGHLLAQLAQRLVAAARDQAGHVGAHAADRRGDRHVVVVEDDDQLLGGLDGVVHRLVGHARAHRAVADHGDDLVVVAALVAGGREAQRRRDRGGRVRRAERVVFAFRTLGEARQAAALAQGADALAPAGEDLVRIGLVADVPDDDVARRVEHVVQRHGQLDHAQARAQVAAGGRHHVDGLGPQLVGELAQLRRGEFARVGRRTDGVEQGGDRRHAVFRIAVRGRACPSGDRLNYVDLARSRRYRAGIWRVRRRGRGAPWPGRTDGPPVRAPDRRPAG